MSHADFPPYEPVTEHRVNSNPRFGSGSDSQNGMHSEKKWKKGAVGQGAPQNRWPTNARSKWHQREAKGVEKALEYI